MIVSHRNDSAMSVKNDETKAFVQRKVPALICWPLNKSKTALVRIDIRLHVFAETGI